MNILYYIIFSLFYLVSLLPMRVLYVLSDCFYIVTHKIVKYRIKVVRKNLRNSFPQKSDKELKEIEKNFYHFFCDYAFETIKLMSISKKNLLKRMRFEGMDEVNKTLSSGISTAIFLGHYGNWEWISSIQLWVSDSVQCNQIYHPLENKAFDRLFLYIRGRQGSKSIAMKNTLKQILSYKKNNKTIIVGYIADQVPLWQNIHHWVNFMQQDTPVFTGAERIIQAAKHAAFYADISRPKRGYYVCKMKRMTENSNSCGEWPLTDIYFNLLQETINKTPHLWLWSHNRWKRTREEFNRLFKVVNGKVVRRENVD